MKERLDRVLVFKGLVKSRELAKALIMEGRVCVDGTPLTKPGTLIRDTSEIVLKEPPCPFVSRGGIKLESALEFFGIDVRRRVIMDAGASTGGFTDCLLKRGAEKVYCIDVGYGQIDWSLRTDPRVVLLERTNIRYLDMLDFGLDPKCKGKDMSELAGRSIDMAVIDVSFISLNMVIPVVRKFIKPRGVILGLVKPQFEVGKGEVGRGGIVKEEQKRLEAVASVQRKSEEKGLEAVGTYRCPLPGQKGNREYFLYLRKK